MKMSSVCIQLVVVAVTLLLSDVTCQTVHNINVSDDVHSVRQRRQAYPLTRDLISAAVDRHNVLRALEGASHMELMVWNENLASKAATWAAQCRYAHDSSGQNVGGGSKNLINIAPIISRWYREKKYYNLDRNTCGKVCGHYTQVVWASSRQVGCAVHRCTSHSHVVCNYSPAGNVNSRRPYTKGPWCSKCSSGAGWCKNKLCNSNCTRAGVNCECAAICYNCAKLDLKTCRCKCAKGWHGMDCTERCRDTHPWCGRSPGYYSTSFCDQMKKVKRRCPAYCGVCEKDPEAKEGLCAPVRGPAAGEPATDSAQTMFIKSHQSTMIFVMIVITFVTSSYDAL